MAFTFTTKNNKKYTYPNVGERNGFVAEKGKGNLSWKEVKAYREVGRTTARKLSNQLRFLCQRNIQYSFDLPYDTGNLQRSIRSRNTPTGFEIYIKDNPRSGAPYQYFLEFGTKKSQKHKGFWSEKMYNIVANTIINFTKGEIKK